MTLHTAIILSFLILSIHYVTCIIRKEMRLDRAEDCFSGNISSPLKAEYLNIQYNEKGAYFTAKGEVLRDLLNNKLRIEVKIVRCANKESLDSCEFFANLKPPNVCFFLNAKGVAWESVFGNIEPPFRCPIKKAVYVLKKSRIDPNLFAFSMDGYYWKINAKIIEENVLIGEYCIEGSIIAKQY